MAFAQKKSPDNYGFICHAIFFTLVCMCTNHLAKKCLYTRLEDVALLHWT